MNTPQPSPTCATCDGPATCFGAYESRYGFNTYACDDCCGHGQEDGQCEPVPQTHTTPQLRALTLHPEWAWASCYLGKGDENRPERVAKMVLNVIGDGWLAIHAGAHVGGRPGSMAARNGHTQLIHMARRAGWDAMRMGNPSVVTVFSREAEAAALSWSVPCGAIVALTRVRPGNPDSPWAVPGQAQIGLRDLFVLPEPVPCSGKQGLWTVSDDVAVKVFAQVKP